jgi:hypothetical protein
MNFYPIKSYRNMTPVERAEATAFVMRISLEAYEVQVLQRVGLLARRIDHQLITTPEMLDRELEFMMTQTDTPEGIALAGLMQAESVLALPPGHQLRGMLDAAVRQLVRHDLATQVDGPAGLRERVVARAAVTVKKPKP